METGIGILMGLCVAGILAEYFVRKKIAKKDEAFRQKLLALTDVFKLGNVVFLFKTHLWSESRKGNVYFLPDEVVFEYRNPNLFAAIVRTRMPAFQIISKKPFAEIEKGVFGYAINYGSARLEDGFLFLEGVVYDESIFFKAGITAETPVTIRIRHGFPPEDISRLLERCNLA